MKRKKGVVVPVIAIVLYLGTFYTFSQWRNNGYNFYSWKFDVKVAYGVVMLIIKTFIVTLLIKVKG